MSTTLESLSLGATPRDTLKLILRFVEFRRTGNDGVVMTKAEANELAEFIKLRIAAFGNKA
jgi:hypothetical protein